MRPALIVKKIRFHEGKVHKKLYWHFDKRRKWINITQKKFWASSVYSVVKIHGTSTRANVFAQRGRRCAETRDAFKLTYFVTAQSNKGNGLDIFLISSNGLYCPYFSYWFFYILRSILSNRKRRNVQFPLDSPFTCMFKFQSTNLLHISLVSDRKSIGI